MCWPHLFIERLTFKVIIIIFFSLFKISSTRQYAVILVHHVPSVDQRHHRRVLSAGDRGLGLVESEVVG